MGKFLLTLISVAMVGSLAQAKGYLVQLNEGQTKAQFEKDNKVRLETISETLKVYRAHSKSRGRSINVKQLKRSLAKSVQKDHKVTLRRSKKRSGKPNDPGFKDQWNFLFEPGSMGIDAVPAWQTFGGGGVDPAGNEIVIAIVDAGFDLDHPDLEENIWVNEGEIPDNGKDDDNNGYIDDIYGWNVETNNDEIAIDDHGTHVAGIAGASGNNGNAGTGVNWDVKIMVVSAGWMLADTGATLQAYEYILKQKQMWIESGGEKGANVVAINSSFGIDYEDCESGDFPLWNQMFNTLGEAGILSVAATTNDDADVDSVGDVPTTCESPYLISVTNSQNTGRKVREAGYGALHIDLAAPGEDIYSTYSFGGFDWNSGTSMAAPHVAGAIAYLHSAASPSFNNLYLSDITRADAALELKDIILETVTPTALLQDQTYSGGILNLNQASLYMANF